MNKELKECADCKGSGFIWSLLLKKAKKCCNCNGAGELPK